MSWIAYAVLILVTAEALPVPSRSKPQVSTSNVSTTRKTEARRVLGQAKAAALKIKSDFKRQFVLDEIGAAQARAGDLEAAIETANRALPFSTATIDQIGEELAATNDLSRAKSLGLQMTEGGSSAVISSMTLSQAKSGKIDEALRTAGQIQFLEVRSYALENIAQQQVIKGDYDGARKTFALARQAHEKGLVTADEMDLMIVMGQLSPENAKATRKTIDSWQDLDKRYAALIGGAEILWKKGDKASAVDWLEDSLRILAVGTDYEFFRYLAVPLLVKLGEKDRAMHVANALSSEMRAKGYSAVAVTSAETKDVATVNAAIVRLRSLAATSSDSGTSEFGVTLMTLNITAALIDNGLFDEASRLLTALEQNPDVVSKISIEPQIQLQRAFILAQQDRFDAARAMALRIRGGSVDEVERGTALRAASLLQTSKNGMASTQSWTSRLKNWEDRAYALLGMAQALLGIDNVKLRYSAIQLH